MYLWLTSEFILIHFCLLSFCFVAQSLVELEAQKGEAHNKNINYVGPENDGILTAREISQLHLHGVDLVTLSACQTGLGEVTGDGVMGLQRGFKKAGVQSIIMSLWEVDDSATQILMTSFYKHLMQGKNKHIALRLAQRELKKIPEYNCTYYWASFILLD